jgi:hypothetical protein
MPMLLKHSLKQKCEFLLLLSQYRPRMRKTFLRVRCVRSRAAPHLWDVTTVSALADLRRHSDVASLKSALQALYSRFGRITRLDILTAMHEGTQQAICFLRMERPEQEQRPMKTLGVGRFGGEVVFVLNLSVPTAIEESGPSSHWVDSKPY